MGGVQRNIELLDIKTISNPNQDGYTPFMQACNANQVHIVELLARSGADTNVQSHKYTDMTVWDLAIAAGNVEVFDLLLKLANWKMNPTDAEYCKSVGIRYLHGNLKYPTLYYEELRLQRFRRNECMNNCDRVAHMKAPIATPSHAAFTSIDRAI